MTITHVSGRWLHVLLTFVASFMTIGSTNAAPFPDIIPLPNGFQLEGSPLEKALPFMLDQSQRALSTAEI